MYSKIAALGALLYAGAEAKRDPFFLGLCNFDDPSDEIEGSVKIIQQGKQGEPASGSSLVNAKLTILGGGNNRNYSVGVYDSHPMTSGITPNTVNSDMGRWWNRNGKIRYMNMYSEHLNYVTDASKASLDGKYLGVFCHESGTIQGACQIRVSAKGDHSSDDTSIQGFL